MSHPRESPTYIMFHNQLQHASHNKKKTLKEKWASQEKDQTSIFSVRTCYLTISLVLLCLRIYSKTLIRGFVVIGIRGWAQGIVVGGPLIGF